MDDCQHSFDELKRLLAKQMVLAYSDFTIPFEIYMDASNKQIGSVIQQNAQPLAFYSRKFTNAQTCYTVIELELLAIVETLQEYCTSLLVTLSRSIPITRTLPSQISILIVSATGN
jgi:hypothetical protein